MGDSGGAQGPSPRRGRPCPLRQGLPSQLPALPPRSPPPAENFPLTPPLFHRRPHPQPRASCLPVSSRAVRRRGPAGGPTPGMAPWGLGAPGGVKGGRLPTSQLRPSTAGAEGARARDPGPVPAPPAVTPRGRQPSPPASAGPQPAAPPSRPLQPPASAAGGPASWPLPRRARPRLLGAPYLLSGPSPGRGWAAARPREPWRRLPLTLPRRCPAPTVAAAASVGRERSRLP